jgi:alginate O-acetyltransferase complex protein AlgI
MLALERAFGKDALYRDLPRPLRVALTFGIVLVSWVFFRSASLGDALRYLGHMAGTHLLGLDPLPAGADLVSGVIYQPYYVAVFLISAVVVWAAPQTWDITRRLSAPRVALVLGLLWLSLAVLFTQAYNPFIYFIF